MNDWPQNAKLDSVLFDLDGTLWDTCPACAHGWNNVLRRHAIDFRTITADDVRSVAGKSHDVCIRTVFAGLPERELTILIEETSEEDNRCVAELGGMLYAGVERGLRELSARLPLFIVSNCQKGYIETFLALNQLGPLFRDFECWGNTGRSKAENLRSVIERNRLRAPVFIGDTEGDWSAAHACEVPFVHAEYGFGRCANAHARVAGFAALTELLLARAPRTR